MKTPEELAMIDADYPGTLLDHVRELRTVIERLEAENRTLRNITKNIRHCADCGSTWYADGFTDQCACAEGDRTRPEAKE